MPLDSIICRRNLDEERGDPWICKCPLCNYARKIEMRPGHMNLTHALLMFPWPGKEKVSQESSTGGLREQGP